MSYEHSTTLRYSDELQKAVSDMVRNSEQTDDVPTMNQSDVLRRLLWEGIDATDGLLELVDDETLILLERERFKERKAKVNNLRTGFETRVKDNFVRRFKNGYGAEQLAKFASNMREEARILWPDQLIEVADPDEAQEMRRRRRECIDYVDAVVDAAIAAVEESERDPLDPETMFESFDGVEEARKSEEVSDLGLRAEARTMIERVDKRHAVDVDAIATVLAKQHGVGRQTTLEVVRDVLTEVHEEQQAVGDEPDDTEPDPGRVTGRDLDVSAGDVDDSGRLDVEGRGLSDTDDAAEPDEELVAAALDELGTRAVGVIPTVLEAQHGADPDEARAALDEAVERHNADDGAQEVPADD